MIPIMVRLFDVEFRIVGGDFKEFPVQVRPYCFSDDVVSVFGRKDKVIITQIDAMIVPFVLL